MTDTGISQAPQQYDLLIYAGIIDPVHPELSTLTLKLRDPYPAGDGISPDIAKQEQVELKPGDDVTVRPGDMITWYVEDANITSILILPKEKGKNVFESGPEPSPAGPGGPKSWSAIADKKISRKEFEEYYICWSQQGITYCFDPKITVNP